MLKKATNQVTETDPNPVHALRVDSYLDTPDRKSKTEEWQGIVIHHTGIGNRSNVNDLSLWRRLNVNIAKWLATNDNVYVSAHYQIGYEGELTQLAETDNHITYHAGKSSWWHPGLRIWKKSCNNFMIGIEILGDGNKQPFSDKQYETLSHVCRAHMQKYNIQPNMIVGHEMVSPGRKQDPGKYFDWTKLYELLYAKY